MIVNIIKEDFKLAEKDKFAFESYTTIKNNVLVIIRKDCFSDDTIKYAQYILNKYLENKDEVIEYLLKNRLLRAYGQDYTEEYIKNNLNEPQIEIINNEFAVITWLNHNLDEHIIEVEVYKDFRLADVTLNG